MPFGSDSIRTFPSGVGEPRFDDQLSWRDDPSFDVPTFAVLSTGSTQPSPSGNRDSSSVAAFSGFREANSGQNGWVTHQGDLDGERNDGDIFNVPSQESVVLKDGRKQTIALSRADALIRGYTVLDEEPSVLNPKDLPPDLPRLSAAGQSLAVPTFSSENLFPVESLVVFPVESPVVFPVESPVVADERSTAHPIPVELTPVALTPVDREPSVMSPVIAVVPSPTWPVLIKTPVDVQTPVVVKTPVLFTTFDEVGLSTPTSHRLVADGSVVDMFRANTTETTRPELQLPVSPTSETMSVVRNTEVNFARDGATDEANPAIRQIIPWGVEPPASVDYRSWVSEGAAWPTLPGSEEGDDASEDDFLGEGDSWGVAASQREPSYQDLDNPDAISFPVRGTVEEELNFQNHRDDARIASGSREVDGLVDGIVDGLVVGSAAGYGVASPNDLPVEEFAVAAWPVVPPVLEEADGLETPFWPVLGGSELRAEETDEELFVEAPVPVTPVDGPDFLPEIDSPTWTVFELPPEWSDLPPVSAELRQPEPEDAEAVAVAVAPLWPVVWPIESEEDEFQVEPEAAPVWIVEEPSATVTPLFPAVVAGGGLVDGVLINGVLVDGVLVDGVLVDGELVDGALVEEADPYTTVAASAYDTTFGPVVVPDTTITATGQTTIQQTDLSSEHLSSEHLSSEPVPVISISELSRSIPGPSGDMKILDSVSFDLAPGDLMVISGPSGSGKSTLLHCIVGLDHGDSGCVRINGDEMRRWSESDRTRFRAAATGIVPQDLDLIDDLTAVDNATLPLLAAGWSSAAALVEANRVLAELGLGDRVEHLPAQLSRGERQRVAVARALVGDPLVVCADDPTSSLDTDSAQLVIDALIRHHRRGATVIVATRDHRFTVPGARLAQLTNGVLSVLDPTARSWAEN